MTSCGLSDKLRSLEAPDKKGGTESRPHECGASCLGPLTFHPSAKGLKITLSHGNCRASRDPETFQNGLAFTNRTLMVNEVVKLRVERVLPDWEGALRVGFSNICPTKSPIPRFAIPDLVENPGYFGRTVPQDAVLPGTIVKFWLDQRGNLRYETSAGGKLCIPSGLDLSAPLWAWVDVYGQSTSVLLRGSSRKFLGIIRRSCPIPRSTLECCYEDTPPGLKKRLKMSGRNSAPRPLLKSQISSSAPKNLSEERCVVCLAEDAVLAFRCGHRCMCPSCAKRVAEEFQKCPLCRQGV